MKYRILLTCSLLSPASIAYSQGLNFDEPQVAAAESTSKFSLDNVTVGGAVDWRLSYQNGAERPVAMLHVTELVLTAAVGPHVSVSAEQLLLTSENETVVGQDHGFVTISLVQLPFLPDGMNVKLGRFRGKFGLDAQTDSPANIFPSQVVRSNGFASDVGVQLDYVVGNFEAILETFNGADYLDTDTGKKAIATPGWPTQVRLTWQPSAAAIIGVSGFSGHSWNTMGMPTMFHMSELGTMVDRSQVIRRERFALDASWRTGPWKIMAEAIGGKDHGRNEHASHVTTQGDNSVQGFLARTDLDTGVIFGSVRHKVAVQWDQWRDQTHEDTVGFLSGAFTLQDDAGWTWRIGASASALAFQGKEAYEDYSQDSPWRATTQFLVSF